MSYTYLQERGEESSAECFSDIPQYVLSRLTLTAERFYSNAKEMGCSPNFHCGMTFKPLTDDLGEDLWTLWQGVFRAKILVAPGKVAALIRLEAAYGVRWHESFARFDPNTFLWKTRQCSLLEGLDEFSETWPRWGMMQNGESSARVMSAHHTGEKESGSWPTPTVDDAHNVTRKSGQFQSLTRRVMFPTPQANEDAAGTPRGKMQRMLGNCEEVRGKTEAEWAGGTLNPTWVEWLMGWPLEWTDLQPLGMDKFRQWQHSHGGFSEAQ